MVYTPHSCATAKRAICRRLSFVSLRMMIELNESSIGQTGVHEARLHSRDGVKMGFVKSDVYDSLVSGELAPDSLRIVPFKTKSGKTAFSFERPWTVIGSDDSPGQPA